MNSSINIYFLFLLLFIYYLYDNKILTFDINREDILTPCLSPCPTITETFDNLFKPNYSNINKNSYSLTVTKEKEIPILYSNFKYSLEYKLADEISKIFKIKYSESEGLNFNLKNLNNNKSLLFVTESDYINYIKENENNYRVVCSFYNLYFIMLSKINLNFNSWLDIKKYNKLLKIGIPNNNTNSYYDAKLLFKSIGINFKDYEKDNKKYKFIYDTEKNLFKRLKLNENDKSIDLIYLTTSYKHPYLEEYLNSNNIHIFGTKGIRDSIISANYGDSVLFKTKLNNKKISNLIVEKNIYTPGNFKLLNNLKSQNIIGSIFENTYSTRLLLLSHKDINKKYIHYLLRNIYANINSINNKLNKYLLNEERNNSIDELDPHNMFYINESLKYHKGAYDFYKEIHYISDKENINNNIFNKTENKNVFSKLFITNN